MDTTMLVAILMALLALAAVYAMIRVGGRSEAGRRAARGYGVFAIGAALQTLDLVRGSYSTTMATVATAALVVGLVLIARGWATRDVVA